MKRNLVRDLTLEAIPFNEENDMTTKMLALPETVDYLAAHITIRTRKIGSRYAAVGAIYFCGRRSMYGVMVAGSRSAAYRAVAYWLETGRLMPVGYRGRPSDTAWESERRLRAVGA